MSATDPLSAKTSNEPTLPYHTPSAPPPESSKRLTHAFRTEIMAFIGEFVGTFMFLALAFAGTQIAVNDPGNASLSSDGDPKPDVGKLLYIAFAFGVSLAINAAIFADVSGAKFNPAVTIALFLTSKPLGPNRFLRASHTILAQLLASIAASGFISALLPGPLTITTTLAPSISITRGLFLEAFVTSMLILTILMLDAGPSKPMYIGLSLFVAELCSVFYTGGSLNPARSFGPAVVVGFKGEHWIYWLGPVLGAGVASGVFWGIEVVRHERV